MDDIKIILLSILSIGLFLRIILGSFISIFVRTNEEVLVGLSDIIVWSNILIILSLLTLTTINISNQNIYKLFYPSIAIIAMLLYEIFITFNFYDRINNNNIPDIIYQWNIWMSIIYLIICMVIYLIKQTNDNDTVKQAFYIKVLYIMISLNIIICYIQNTIMNYYVVDTVQKSKY